MTNVMKWLDSAQHVNKVWIINKKHEIRFSITYAHQYKPTNYRWMEQKQELRDGTEIHSDMRQKISNGIWSSFLKGQHDANIMYSHCTNIWAFDLKLPLVTFHIIWSKWTNHQYLLQFILFKITINLECTFKSKNIIFFTTNSHS